MEGRHRHPYNQNDHYSFSTHEPMHYLNVTLTSPEGNLALDEALLLANGGSDADTLRVWESPTPMVVLGRASRIEEEVDTEACERLGVPVLRRVSGGATIVCGPGCLMYAVSFGMVDRPELQAIDQCHVAALGPMADALRTIEPTVHRAGTSDLAFRHPDDETQLKFSGNSLRVTRDRMLYHGTLLYDFDLSLISELLRTPPRQPDYRERRAHAEFVGNLPASSEQLRQALADAWSVSASTSQLSNTEASVVRRLVETRYATDAWRLAR